MGLSLFLHYSETIEIITILGLRHTITMRSVTTADFKQNTTVHVQESASLHRNLLDSAGLTQNFRQAEEEKLVGLRVLLC